MNKIQRLIELISEEIAALRAPKQSLHHPVPPSHAGAAWLDDLPPADYDPSGMILPPLGPEDRL